MRLIILGFLLMVVAKVLQFRLRMKQVKKIIEGEKTIWQAWIDNWFSLDDLVWMTLMIAGVLIVWNSAT